MSSLTRLADVEHELAQATAALAEAVERLDARLAADPEALRVDAQARAAALEEGADGGYLLGYGVGWRVGRSEWEIRQYVEGVDKAAREVYETAYEGGLGDGFRDGVEGLEPTGAVVDY